eukprot:3941201-Rhodomonas_salina.12
MYGSAVTIYDIRGSINGGADLQRWEALPVRGTAHFSTRQRVADRAYASSVPAARIGRYTRYRMSVPDMAPGARRVIAGLTRSIDRMASMRSW